MKNKSLSKITTNNKEYKIARYRLKGDCEAIKGRNGNVYLQCFFDKDYREVWHKRDKRNWKNYRKTQYKVKGV
jgi:hypothetical protein